MIEKRSEISASKKGQIYRKKSAETTMKSGIPALGGTRNQSLSTACPVKYEPHFTRRQRRSVK